MLKLHHYFLATTCLALVGAVAPADAATCNGDTNCSLGTQAYVFGSSDVFGGGSSLVAPYWRQTSDCYAEPADLVTKGSPPTYVDELLFDWKGNNPQNCATQQVITNATTWYISTGSGSGILGVFSHDPKSFWGEVNTNGPQYFPEVFYGLSDAGLGTTDVDAYDNGTGGGTYCQGSTCISIAGVKRRFVHERIDRPLPQSAAVLRAARPVPVLDRSGHEFLPEQGNLREGHRDRKSRDRLPSECL